MSTHAIFRPPAAENEAVRDYAPGSPERAGLQRRLDQMLGERPDIPLVIGGEDVRTGETRSAVMPHRKEHVLADVHQGGPDEVQRAVDAAAEAWKEWHRWPWEERAAVFLRAAELLAGPWRDTLLAATMLGQSKTAHQAEIDAAAELIDFFRFNVEFMTRIYSEQPISSRGTWNRMEYRPLEGFVFAVSPFNFTAIGGNLTSSPALMGNTVIWKPAGTAMLSSYYLMRLFQEAGLPPGVINLVYGGGATIGDAALASPELAGIHFTGSTPVFQGMWRAVGENIARYRNYPRIVGETGGKDFIVAHPSADVESLATAIVRGSFEYQGQKCSAASRIYAPSNLWPELKERLQQEVSTIRMGDVADFQNFMGAVIDSSSFATQKEAIEEARSDDRSEVVVGGGYDDSEGYFVEPTVIETKDPDFRAAARRALRPGRHDLRLRREEVGGHLAAGGQDRAVRSDGRGLLGGSRRGARRAGEAPLRGRQLLRQRQAHRCRRRAAAVRRRPRLGDERQGGLDVEPDPLGQPALDQGDVRPAEGLPLPVPLARLERRRAGRLVARGKHLADAEGPGGRPRGASGLRERDDVVPAGLQLRG